MGLRVGLLTQWFDPEHGPAVIPGVLARELARRGHHVSVLTGLPNYPYGEVYPGYSSRLYQRELMGDVDVHRTWLYPSHDSSRLRRLTNYVSFAATASLFGLRSMPEIDVLWVYNSPISIAAPMWITQHSRGVPVVLHIMDVWPESVAAAGFEVAPGATTRAINWWCSAMYRSADAVCYISPGAGRLLNERGVPLEKLHHAPLWANEDVYRPGPDDGALRSKLGFGDDEVVVMYAGSLGHAQDVLFLVRAFESVDPSIPIRLVVVGSGSQREEIARMAELSCGRIHVLTNVSNECMHSLMVMSDVHFAGFSNSVMASFSMPSKVQAVMAAGKPLIALDNGDLGHLVKSTDTGFVLERRDPQILVGLLETIGREGRSDCVRLGAKARSYYVENFSLSVGVDRVEALLIEVAAKSRRHS